MKKPKSKHFSQAYLLLFIKCLTSFYNDFSHCTAIFQSDRFILFESHMPHVRAL